MILKSFEIKKINQNINHLILFYGNNEGLKNEAIDILNKDKLNILSYEEKEIFDNENNFIENILSKSLFEKQKFIVIKRATDKIFKVIEILNSKNLEDVTIVLNSDNDQMTVSMAATGETMDNPQSWAYDSANDVIWQGRHSNGVPAVYKITMGSSSITVGSAQTLGQTDTSSTNNQPLLLETSAGVMVHISVISVSQLTANAFKEVGGSLSYSSTPFSIDSSFQSYATQNDGSLTYWARYDATTGYVAGSRAIAAKATTMFFTAQLGRTVSG